MNLSIIYQLIYHNFTKARGSMAPDASADTTVSSTVRPFRRTVTDYLRPRNILPSEVGHHNSALILDRNYLGLHECYTATTVTRDQKRGSLWLALHYEYTASKRAFRR